MAKSTRKRDALPEKTCITCGRPFAWRKKWAKSWNEVKYCSKACRSQRPGDLEERLEQAIIELINLRGTNATICPSEAARSVAPEQWKPLMEKTREAARRLAHRGVVEITQRGKRVEPSGFRGPIRLGRPKQSTTSASMTKL